MSKRFLGRIFLSVGISLVIYWGVHNYLRYQALTLGQEVIRTTQSSNQKLSAPIKLLIASSNINVEITAARIVDQRWVVEDKKASYLPILARPGEAGNIVIYGHNTKAIFGNLKKVQTGDEIIVMVESNKEKKYQVEDIQTVNTSETELLQPTNYEVLTVYTCTGFLDSKRLVIRAKPVIESRKTK